MQVALEQAQLAAAASEAPVGAVLVSQGDVIAKAHNRTLVDHDPSGHAEIIALREAGRRVENHRLGGMTLYVTLEPCAMCVGAIVQARIARVVFGAYDQKAGALGSAIDLSDSSAFNHRFEVQGGLMAEDCADILQRFFAARR
jgi:tRNA(adenine34) deaminase